jgi:hypothetical protein
MSKYPKLPLEPDSPEARREFLRKCGRFAAVTTTGHDYAAVGLLSTD